jgi:hypothetical protein
MAGVSLSPIKRIAVEAPVVHVDQNFPYDSLIE